MSLGTLLCLIVLFGVILSFLIALPEWAPMVMLGLLALAYLTGGFILWRREPVA